MQTFQKHSLVARIAVEREKPKQKRDGTNKEREFG